MESCFYLSVIANGKSDIGKATDKLIHSEAFLNIHKGPEIVLDMPMKQKWGVGEDGVPSLKQFGFSLVRQIYQQELSSSEISGEGTRKIELTSVPLCVGFR